MEVFGIIALIVLAIPVILVLFSIFGTDLGNDEDWGKVGDPEKGVIVRTTNDLGSNDILDDQFDNL